VQESSKLRPISFLQTKFWQMLSLFLIGGGFIMISWGGWLFYQQQLELSQPPPAPIVNSLDLLPTFTPSPTQTTAPTATRPLAATATWTATATLAGQNQVQDSLLIPTETATATASPSPAPTATPLPATTPTVALDPAEYDLLSLADNPLLVPEPANPPDEAAVADVASPQNASTGQQLPAPISRIVAESIELDAPVVEVGWQEMIQNGIKVNIWNVANFAAGWHKNSALPGQGGNIVLSGHHNIQGEVFRRTIDLEIGDTISLFMGDQTYSYIVTDKFIIKDKGEPQEVRIANARWIGLFEDERVTLVTCWPYTNNTHRVIVIAKPSP
jgi:sortase A